MFEPDTAQIDPLSLKPWAKEFNLGAGDRAERVKAERVARLETLPGQSFRVLKASGGAVAGGFTGMPRQVEEFDHFPTSEEVWEAVGENWGGGVYSIRCNALPGALLKTYTYAGVPSRVPSQRNGRKPETLAEGMEGRAIEAVGRLFDDNPEMAAAFGLALIQKKLGVKGFNLDSHSKKDDFDERLLREELESNPALKEQYVAKLIESKLGGKETFLEQLKDYRRIQKELGLGEGKPAREDNSWSAAFKEFAKSGQLSEVVGKLADTVKDTYEANKAALAAQSPQPAQRVVSAQSPPHALPSPNRPANGAAGAAQPPSAQPPQPGINLPSPQEFISFLSTVDPSWLLSGAKGDAREFIRGCYETVYQFEGEDPQPPEALSAAMVVRLIRDNDSRLLHSHLHTQILPKLKGEWKQVGVMAFGKERYEKALELVGELASDSGLQWLTVARGMCFWLEREIAKGEAGGGNAADGAEGAAPPAFPPPGKGAGDDAGNDEEPII